MYSTSNFRQNLAALKEARALSLAEFSEELGIPKSTLQSVLGSGQTTLDTACRISNAAGISLSALTGSALPADRFEILNGFLKQFTWFSEQDSADQRKVANAFAAIFEVLEK